MDLHSNQELLQDAIQAAADHFDIKEIYVEKDYWVTVALYEIFHSEIASEVVFKGGTALSKCHKLIDRFSEDIDLVILKHEGESDNQLKQKIRKISKAVERVIPEEEVEGLTNKRGNIRKTVHQYDNLYQGSFGQVREQVVVEATWLGNFEPYSTMKASSYITEMMYQMGQDELIEQYNIAPFPIQVLGKRRTFCEKIMSLVRFSRSEKPVENLRNKIRHVYDIYQMLKDQEIKDFFYSDDFDNMLMTVGNDDMISYKNNNEWISEHPSTAMIFDEPAETWSHLNAEYKTHFKDLVTGELPSSEHMVDTLQSVADRLKEIEWLIQS